jgi:hypothetical protein
VLLAAPVLGLLVAPLASEAQPPRTIPRIAFLALSPGLWAVMRTQSKRRNNDMSWY